MQLFTHSAAEQSRRKKHKCGVPLSLKIHVDTWHCSAVQLHPPSKLTFFFSQKTNSHLLFYTQIFSSSQNSFLNFFFFSQTVLCNGVLLAKSTCRDSIGRRKHRYMQLLGGQIKKFQQLGLSMILLIHFLFHLFAVFLSPKLIILLKQEL